MVVSDGGVTVSDSPVRSSDLFAGELYDARMEQEGWDCPGFDDNSWKAGILSGNDPANLVAQYGEPVRPVLGTSRRLGADGQPQGGDDP